VLLAAGHAREREGISPARPRRLKASVAVGCTVARALVRAHPRDWRAVDAPDGNMDHTPWKPNEPDEKQKSGR
jgi:hypothetical protein